MFARLSRTRVPFRRYIQTESFRSTSTTTKYAIAVGTVATVAFFGIQTTRADSGPSQHFNRRLRHCRLRPLKTSNPSYLKGSRKTRAPKSPPCVRPSWVQRKLRKSLDGISAKSNTIGTQAHAARGSNDAEEAETSGDDSGGGAFNPETGEINWDCPCLGGMAQGPCGPQFREAFSCFVYSEDEPKGINCVEKFQAMQTCFREHPDVYASEIADDDEAAEAAETETAEKEGSLPKPDNEVSASSADASESAPPPAPVAKPSEDLPSSQQ
ncbi:hypothetical protein B0H13DRAFT_1167207 [Mycena leptocephala]|nr:hypothetical protein B0H13DRAFT_1167207 [Mycena leptocephala]